jgi:hypothetical protein
MLNGRSLSGKHTAEGRGLAMARQSDAAGGGA